MLWRILQEHGGLPDDHVVCFANTGREDEGTLRFVALCESAWSVPIKWLQYAGAAGQRVTRADAARKGEPFAALIKKKSYLPNPVARFCTVELKIKPIEAYCCSLGWTDWTTLIGIRADEQRRVAKLSAGREAPLVRAGITVQDVAAFWSAQPFDLDIPPGTGNCDLCFLKGARQIASLIAEKPERADWWIEQETAIGGTFRADRPNYAAMKYIALHQIDMLREHDEAIEDCFCVD